MSLDSTPHPLQPPALADSLGNLCSRGQPGLLGRTAIVANKGEPAVPTDGDRMAVMFCELTHRRPEQTAKTFQFL